MPENLNELIDEAAEQIVGLMHACDPCDVPATSLVARYVRAAVEAERDNLAAELATTKADLDNERAVRAVQAGKLAELSSLAAELLGQRVPTVIETNIAVRMKAIIERGA